MCCLFSGVVSTVAGGGGDDQSGYVDGMFFSARFNFPTSVAVTSMGDVFVADTYNNIIRKVTSSGKFVFLISCLCLLAVRAI